MLVIATNITSRDRRIATALRQRAVEPLRALAEQCVAAGADILDINLQQHFDSPDVMEFAVKTVQAVTDKQLCLSPIGNPASLEAGLVACKQPPLVNYVSLEEQRIETLLPLAARHNAGIVLLPTSPGAPGEAKEILKTASVLVGAANEIGIGDDRIFIDPGVLHLTSDMGQRHVQTLLELLPAIAETFEPPVQTTCWVGNISAGVAAKLRPVVDRTFLAMLAGAGLSSVFLDVLQRDMMRTVRVLKALKNEAVYADRDIEL